MSIAEKLPNWFLKTKAGKEATAEAAATTLAERQQWAAEIATLRRDATKTLAPLIEKKHATKRARDKAHHTLSLSQVGGAKRIRMSAALRLKNANRLEAEQDVQRIKDAADVRIDRLEAELLASADESIAVFINFATAVAGDRRTDSHTSVATNVLTGAQKHETTTNATSVATRMAAARAAIVAAEELKLLPLTPAELAEKIAALRDSIPSAGVLEVTHVEPADPVAV